VKAADLGLRRAAEQGGAVAGVLSPFLTVEEAYLMARYLKGLGPAGVLAIGPVPRRGEDVTFKPDQNKGRTGDTSFVLPRPFTIHAEKCPNRRGVEAVLEHFQGSVISFEELSRRVSAGEFRGLYVASDAIDPWIDEAAARDLRAKVEFLVVQDTNVTPLAQLADVVLAGATFAEKAGSYVNADGRLQYAEAALPPRDGALPDLDLFAILLQRPGGPPRSGEVLAELAEAIPAFAAARGGNVPRLGCLLGAPPPATAASQAPEFLDSWFVPQGAARWR
jgi:NADH-quinone oxidoreductase subunit G